MKLYDFFMLLENLEAFRTAKGVPLACQKFIRIDHRWDFVRIANALQVTLCLTQQSRQTPGVKMMCE